MVGVKLVNLTKIFGKKVVAVDNLNLEIRDKEFLTLLGPSGCGKTTTLRLIAGLETPTSGEVYIGDQLVNDLPPKDRNVAMVFQSYALYPHMTVFDNIAFPLKLRKVPKDEIRRRVKEVAELLRISELLDRKPRELSGGQRQRVALGRAIVRKPSVFLLDEPLSNLDAKLRVYMRAELKRLQRMLGVTTIYVTHDQVEAMTMSDRIALMNNGVLQQVGTPHEVYDRPANIWVAGFIGSPPMNFFDCTFTREDDYGVCDAGVFRIKLPPDLSKLIEERITSPEIVLGIRPEHIEIYKSKGEEDDIESEIYVVEPIGDHTIVDIRLGEYVVKVRAPSTFRAEIGEKTYLRFDKSRIYVFDKKTEKLVT